MSFYKENLRKFSPDQVREVISDLLLEKTILSKEAFFRANEDEIAMIKELHPEVYKEFEDKFEEDTPNLGVGLDEDQMRAYKQALK